MMDVEYLQNAWFRKRALGRGGKFHRALFGCWDGLLYPLCNAPRKMHPDHAQIALYPSVHDRCRECMRLEKLRKGDG